MKYLPLLGALFISVSPAGALPTRLLCSEIDGIHIMESNEVMDYFDSKRAEQPICGPDEYFDNDCAREIMYGEDDPYTIEFNPDTQEAVVDRSSDIIFYSIEETRNQIKLVRKRRPLLESTYQSTGNNSFQEYSIFIDRGSLSSVYTEINDRTDWGAAGEGGILYTTIINGSCKYHPL